MILNDILILLALFLFCIAWWRRGDSLRDEVLLVSAVAAVIVGLIGTLDHRWQDLPATILASILFVVVVLVRKLQKQRRTGTPWISGVLIVLLTVLALSPIYLFPVKHLPEPLGPYVVGVSDFELADHARLGVYAAGEDEPRRLLIRAWYPAESFEGMTARPYFVGEEVNSTATGFGKPLGMPFLLQYLKHVRTNSFVDAQLLEGAAELPVVIFNHGHGVFLGQNTALMEHLASHGYLVFSINHTFDSWASVMPDGSVIDMDPALLEVPDVAPELMESMDEASARAFGGETLDEIYSGREETFKLAAEAGYRLINESPAIWVDDIAFVLDQLSQKAVPEKVMDVVSVGDYTRIAHAGMSFGGSAAAAFCFTDTRCKAAFNLDGTNYHKVARENNIPVPFLMMHSDYLGLPAMLGKEHEGRGDNEFSYEWPETTGLRSDLFRFMIRDSKHMGYSDLPLFTRNPIKSLALGAIDGETIIEIVNDFVLGFLDTYLSEKQVDFPVQQIQAHEHHMLIPDTSDIPRWWIKKNPEDSIELVNLETGAETLKLVLYPKKEQEGTGRFLKSVSSGLLNGKRMYRFQDDHSGVQTGEGLRRIADGLLFCADKPNEAGDPEVLNPESTMGADSIKRDTARYFVFRFFPSDDSSESENSSLDAVSATIVPGRVLEGMSVVRELPMVRFDQLPEICQSGFEEVSDHDNVVEAANVAEL